jgi:hypothetical protein
MLIKKQTWLRFASWDRLRPIAPFGVAGAGRQLERAEVAVAHVSSSCQQGGVATVRTPNALWAVALTHRP